ncbi:MAG: hypothetical protein II247_00790 [Lachnospiraceae bacterium]|nr:hypothetical protein [Lachnospiraceae bacterium]
MRKTAVVLTAVIGSALIAGCQADFPSQDTDGYVKEIVNDVKEQAVQELKKAFASEVSDFFASDDLSVTLGMTGEEKEQLEKSIREYIDAYSKDEQKLGEAKEEVEKLFENADGLTAEELQNKVKKIFQ